jgi:hypothetical protein
MEKLNSARDADGLCHLAECLRSGLDFRVDKLEAVRWYRRGSTPALLSLGLCYERGEGVPQDMTEAVRLYRLAADRGSKDALLSLGLFHWCGMAGFDPNPDEARRYWEMAGFDLLVPANRVEAADDTVHRSQIAESEDADEEAPIERDSRSEEETDVEETRSDRFASAKVETRFQLLPSFEFLSDDRLRSIESVVLFDGQRSVRDFFGATPSVSELSRLIGEGIVREGNRCLHCSRDSADAQKMFDEVICCSDLRSLMQLCVNFYTRATFLYRCVNKFMRDGANEETGRNVGIYIGILRECFCVRSRVNPLQWTQTETLYRGADFPIGVVVDYARRKGELIWWQGFTSSSSDINQALLFPGNILFEISLTDTVPSLSEYSALPHEREFVLNPYEWFALDGIRWGDSTRRWIIELHSWSSPAPVSWFGDAQTT